MVIAPQGIRIAEIKTLRRDSPRTDGNAEIIIGDGCHHFHETGGERRSTSSLRGRQSSPSFAEA